MSADADEWQALLGALAPDLIIVSLLAVLTIGLVVGLAVWIGRRNQTVLDDPGLWSGRDYHCPACGAAMRQGWVLLGKGAIWSQRGAGRPGAFATIGSVLPNTLSMRLRPAANMAWHCGRCRILIIDHDKLVR